MAPQAGKCFDGLTTLTDAHDSVQTLAGNATWLNQFSPVVKGREKNVAEVLLWLFYRLGLCCGIVGRFAMYIGGKVTSHPNLITIYMAYQPQNLTSEISVLLQITNTPAFSLESLDFVFVPYYSRPGDNIYYAVRHGDITIAVRIVCVECASPCGPRSNLNLVHFMWSTFAYYCSNYAIVVVPSRTSGDKILYVRHYKAEIGGEDSRVCRRCIWDIEDPRLLYNVQCLKPNPCTCILCSKQPLTLKSLASKFFFPMNTLYDYMPSQIPCKEYNIW